MRRAAVALVCLAMMALASVAAQDWHFLTSNEGRFTVSLPARPVYSKVPLGDRLVLHQWLHETPDTAYLVSYIDYSRGEVARSGGAEGFLDKMARGFFSEGRARLSERRISHGGYTAREAVALTGDGLAIRQRHLLVGDRGYIWNYSGRPGTQDGLQVERFLNSLTVRR